METQLIRSLGALGAIRDEWDGLAASHACPALDHDWLMSCAEAFYAETDLRIVVARQAGALSAAAPLGLETTATGARLGLLGARWLYEPSGWVFASPSAARGLVDPVLALGTAVVLLRVPAESALCAALADCTRRRAFVAARTTQPSLGVDTSGRWDEYYARLSSHTTRNLARLRRRAERTYGHVEAVTAAPQPGEVDSILEQLVEIEGSGWKGRAHSSLRHRPELLEFFRRYTRRVARAGKLRMTSLVFGSHIAAVELAVEAHGRWWQLKIGYHDELAAFYPGLQLTQASIHAAFERGLRSYEFLGIAEPWEERWHPVARAYKSIAVYPSSVRGIASACRDLGASVWRRARGRLRATREAAS